MSSFCKCKSYSHFFSKNISVYAIFKDQSFNDTLTNDIVNFVQLGPEGSQNNFDRVTSTESTYITLDNYRDIENTSRVKALLVNILLT